MRVILYKVAELTCLRIGLKGKAQFKVVDNRNALPLGNLFFSELDVAQSPTLSPQLLRQLGQDFRRRSARAQDVSISANDVARRNLDAVQST